MLIPFSKILKRDVSGALAQQITFSIFSFNAKYTTLSYLTYDEVYFCISFPFSIF